ADRAPMARKFLDEQRGRFRYLVTKKLLAELAHEAAQQKIPNNIVEHLFDNLSGERERALERQPKKIPLEICFGLSATHYYLSDGADFQSSRSVKEVRSEEHTSELQSRFDLVCRLLLEKKKDK